MEELRKEREFRAALEAKIRELRESLTAKSENVVRQLEGRFDEIDAGVKAEGEKRQPV